MGPNGPRAGTRRNRARARLAVVTLTHVPNSDLNAAAAQKRTESDVFYVGALAVKGAPHAKPRRRVWPMSASF